MKTLLFALLGSWSTLAVAWPEFVNGTTPECVMALPVFAVVPRTDFTTTETGRRLYDRPWVHNEDASNYDEDFGPSFRRLLTKVTALGPEGHWIDLGAGKGAALDDYYNGTDPLRWFPSWKRANITGIELSPDVPAFATRGGVGWFKSTRMDDPKLDVSAINKGQLITDMIGPLSYSEHLDVALRNTLALLASDGTLLVHANSTHTTIYTKAGKPLTFDAWLAQLPGIEVKRVGKPREGDTLEITLKAGATVKVPTLRRVAFEAGAPPKRVFVEE